MPNLKTEQDLKFWNTFYVKLTMDKKLLFSIEIKHKIIIISILFLNIYFLFEKWN